MRRFTVTGAIALALTLAVSSSALAATPPPEFGTDWDDPRTAAPPVAKPAGQACTVRIVDNKFVNFDPFKGSFTPPTACGNSWEKVVLKMSGAVKGRQFDRLGRLEVGDVTIFKTSTPEPSVDGIQWTVEKDVTAYAQLLKQPQPVTMWLGNVVNDTYTGILDIQVDLSFYAGPAPTGQPEQILPLTEVISDGSDRVGSLTVPRNTERLIAEIYATGSGGGCEEFWYITAPPASGYSCPADNGPYREVQVLIDGQVAGIAAPYPHIYTGGWSNPFLWYALPAPRAFDLKPLQYDLGPFIGRLTDGVAHKVTVRVVGVPAGQSGWEVPTSFLVWRDAGSTQVTGRLLAASLSPMENDVRTSTPEGFTEVKTTASHNFNAVGFVETSRGRTTFLVNRALANTSTHRWGAEENPDSLKATWTDTSVAIVAGHHPSVTRQAATYAIDGTISISASNRLNTSITLTDAMNYSRVGSGKPLHWTLDDTFTGQAEWTLGVPRPDRHAQGTSTERYQWRGDTCYDKTLATVNGIFVQDSSGCPS